MPDGSESKEGKPIPTEGFPVAYANLASTTVNFNDIRVYFSDTQAKQIVTERAAGVIRVAENLVSPRICVVMTPEFARGLRDALALSISQYEENFGSIRTQPEQGKQTPGLKRNET